MPTRGSPVLSSWTSGRLASQSMSRETSATSPSGSLSPIFPVDLPKPRADQVSTAYPSRARFSAWPRTSSLLPPKPCASRTAGRRPRRRTGGEVRGVDAHPVAPAMTRSSRCTAGASSGDGGPCAGAGEHDDGGHAGDQPSWPGPRSPQSGQSKIHASTVRAATDIRASHRAEPPHPAGVRHGSGVPQSWYEKAHGKSVCGDSPRRDDRGGGCRRAPLRQPGAPGVGGTLPGVRRTSPVPGLRARRGRPRRLCERHRDHPPRQGCGDAAVRVGGGGVAPAQGDRAGAGGAAGRAEP